MNFITPVELPAHLPCLRHTDHLLLLGSCFAANMGARFTEAKFSCDVNPYGVLYNPLSISAALREIVFGKVYGKKDLFSFAIAGIVPCITEISRHRWQTKR